MQMLKDRKDVLRYPRLDTVLMVENFVVEHGGEYTKSAMWKVLPKGIMYQTFSVIIDYLLECGKIAVDKKGKIGWIYNPELVKKYANRPDLRWTGK